MFLSERDVWCNSCSHAQAHMDSESNLQCKHGCHFYHTIQSILSACWFSIPLLQFTCLTSVYITSNDYFDASVLLGQNLWACPTVICVKSLIIFLCSLNRYGDHYLQRCISQLAQGQVFSTWLICIFSTSTPRGLKQVASVS